jgi:hypothetical protein
LRSLNAPFSLLILFIKFFCIFSPSSN